ncbi:hypothetical protein WJX73_001824 [Symbiochloris irregularis]|uniref:CNNM transmembrane domain-containing protein n=1 Tax=Symbiochloris irregularis TaxID=706552 RepID=A0AAW1NSR3_9CHLO
MVGVLENCVENCDLSLPATAAAHCLQECVNLVLGSAANHDFGADNEHREGLSTGISVFLAILLVPLTGLFAGLTLGLLSLDLVGLKIIEQAGEPHERIYARRIIPVREQGNLLLCTLLLGNTVINSAISILLADLTTGFIGLLVATFIILIFGEIVPQSICTQKDMGLKIGAHSIWLVKAFMIILSPIVWPISRILDRFLGRDIGTVYSQEELKHLIDIHVSDPTAQAESGLTCADQKLIIGALEYKDKLVRDHMTSLEQIFMLERSLRLTFQTMLAIYKSGFTRIPVYEGNRHNIVGILYVKDLILVDPDDEIELSAVLSFRGRNAGYVSETEPLDSVFKLFMNTSNHMLLAHSEEHDVTGLITLEDVMEELIQAEIVDETDVYENVNTRLPRQVAARVDVATFMMMFEHKLRHQQVLSESEIAAVAAFLSLNVPEFSHLAVFELPLKGLISHAEVLEKEMGASHPPHKGSPTDPRDTGSPFEAHALSPASSTTGQLLSRRSHSLQHSDFGNSLGLPEPPSGQDDALVLYEHGDASDAFTIILQGRALIRTGIESFELELGPWSILGNKALSTPAYVPDFSAVIWPPYRVLRIRKAAFHAAVEATRLGPVMQSQRARLASVDSTTASVPGSSVHGSEAHLIEGLERKSFGRSTPKRLPSGPLLRTSPPATVNSAVDIVRTASPCTAQAVNGGLHVFSTEVGIAASQVGRHTRSVSAEDDRPDDSDQMPLLPRSHR